MSTTRTTQRSTWRVVDIVIASVIAVASGVVFWAWSASYGLFSLAFTAFPPGTALLTGLWLFPAVLGALIIRKPGAALFCEVLAAVVEALLGTHWGMPVLISGLVQGLGAELVFALFRYRRWNATVALFAGALSGLFMGVNEIFIYYPDMEPVKAIIYVACAVISGAVIAGFLAWILVQNLAKTGVLSSLASGKTRR